MAFLTVDEQELFAKYWGKELDEEFWADVNARYLHSNLLIALPVEYNFQNVKRVLSLLDCPPGRCGACCKYEKIHVSQEDINKIVANTEYKSLGVKKDKDGCDYLEGSNGGCPFLKENTCIIWDNRPFICYLYPIQGGRPALLDGQQKNQMMLRLYCPSSISITRRVIEMALENPNSMLLPDLSVINRYKKDKISI
jgi:hypothetical protein